MERPRGEDVRGKLTGLSGALFQSGTRPDATEAAAPPAENDAARVQLYRRILS